MVDNEVHITGSDLPEWATEKTMADVLAQLRSMTNISQQQKQAIEKGVKGIQGTADTETKLGALTKGLKQAGEEAVDTASGFKKLEKGPLKDFGKALKDSSKTFKIGAAGVGGLFALIGKGISIYRSNLDVLVGLTDQGIRFEGSFSDITRTLALSGMTFEQFNEIAGKYAQVIGTNGLRNMIDFVKATGKITGGLDSLGLTTADATEFAAEYLDQQRLAGVFGRASAKGQAQALTENIERLTAYSKILNVSRKEMMDQTRAMLDRDDLQSMFFTMAPEERANAEKTFKSISAGMASMGEPGKELLTLFTDMAASPVAESSEAFRKLAAVSPELAQEMAGLSRLNKDLSQSELRVMIERASSNKALIDSQRLAGGEIKETAQLIALLGMKSEEAQVKEAKLRIDHAESDSKLAFEEWLKTIDPAAKGAVALEDGLNQVKATFDRFIVEGLDAATKAIIGPEGMAGAMGSMGEVFRRGATDANAWLDNLKAAEDPVGMIMKTAMGAIGKILTVVGEMLVAAIEKGFAMITENSVIGRAQKGAGGILDWVTGVNRDAERALMSAEEQIAEERRVESLKPSFVGFTPTQLKRTIQESQATPPPAVDRPAAAPKEGAPTSTAPTAMESGMSEADVAKLDIAGQQLYFTKRLVRLVESNGGLMA